MRAMGMEAFDHCTCSRRFAPPHRHAPTCRVLHEYLHATLHRSVRSLEESTTRPHLRQQLLGAAAVLGQLLEDDLSELPTSEGWLWTLESPLPNGEEDPVQVGTPVPSEGGLSPRALEAAAHTPRGGLVDAPGGATAGAGLVVPRPAYLPEPGSPAQADADTERFYSPRHTSPAEEAPTDHGREQGNTMEDTRSEDLPAPAPNCELLEDTLETATMLDGSPPNGPTAAAPAARFKACPLSRPPAAQPHGDGTPRPTPQSGTPTGSPCRQPAQDSGAEEDTNE